MTQIVHFGDTAVEVRQTDNGFKAEEFKTAEMLVEEYAKEHPFVHGLSSYTASDKADYIFEVEQPDGDHVPPGRGNIGTERTDASDRLTENGLSLSIVYMETAKRSLSAEWAVGVKVEGEL